MSRLMQNPLFGCPKHGVPFIPTRSGMQFVCPRSDCDEHVKALGPWKEDCIVSPKPIVTPAPHTQPALSREEREKRIADAIARKKAAAVAPGVVTPSKPERKVKIPAKINATTGKTKKDAAREARNADAVDDTSTTGAEVALDVELDANVAKATTKKEKDPNAMTVSDVAREAGVDPKRARARLRALGKSAVEGRWPTVVRGSKEHDQMLVDIADPKEAQADDEGEAEDGDEE